MNKKLQLIVIATIISIVAISGVSAATETKGMDATTYKVLKDKENAKSAIKIINQNKPGDVKAFIKKDLTKAQKASLKVFLNDSAEKLQKLLSDRVGTKAEEALNFKKDRKEFVEALISGGYILKDREEDFRKMMSKKTVDITYAIYTRLL